MSKLPGVTRINSKKSYVRPVFMQRTSDEYVGSSSIYASDTEQAIKVIVRKLSERCASTQELLHFVKKYRLAESSRVDIAAFRHILNKFGIYLSAAIIDKVFTAYDRDKSGSIDIDEFSQLVMNDDYAFPNKTLKNSLGQLKPQELLRQCFAEFMAKHPQTFILMQQRKVIGYLDLMCDITRMNTQMLTDKDVRSVFLLLDLDNKGFIDAQTLITWINTGTITIEVRPSTSSGRPNTTNIALKPLTSSLLDAKSNFFKRATFLRPNTDSVLNNPMSDKVIYGSSVTNADRKLREILRVSFRSLKQAIEQNANTDRVGHINCDLMYSLINKYCGVFSPVDFKLVLQLLKKDETSKRIDYKHFFMNYDPAKLLAEQLRLSEQRHKLILYKPMSVGVFAGYPPPR